MASVKFVSLNCRGLNDYKKRVILYDWLSDSKCDVAFLQETHYVEERKYIYNSRWNGTSFHCFSTSSHSKGVSILINKNFQFKLLDQHRSTDGRMLLLNIEHESRIITVVNVYAPNTEKCRVDFFRKVSKWIAKYSMNDENVILVGDFNCNILKDNDRSSHVLKNVLFRFDFVDLWKTLKSDKNGFTWCDGSNTAKSIIDYIFF